MSSERRCLECGDVLIGRSDKKFCNDSCRSAYNNRQARGARSPTVRRIQRILLRNRHILEELVGQGETAKVSGQKLRTLGFNFQYHTHTYTSKKQTTYIFIFEYGYLPLDNDWFFVVKREHQT
ncbi:MAG: DUF2116 family Zn-ribbon domain-containing protein [Flavobacteriales bacterium]|nr:DUF2116 family Zn-ribbon domain-containing protein [Flavobacteriales bacterium]MCX7768772.1 DUF2116 family Zn-ribbon domain-containing protein [Flavobacteriales bacterium]MDW8409434.1 hypothetical protein [Flavobacteriales bacterium]